MVFLLRDQTIQVRNEGGRSEDGQESAEDTEGKPQDDTEGSRPAFVLGCKQDNNT
jgi:hypothetical protein